MKEQPQKSIKPDSTPERRKEMLEVRRMVKEWKRNNSL